ncbi:transcriptional regulator, LacI family [Pseudoduganella lurida]|uniref:Transcriptional regulator, LacI family n=1 Tax=Pseudoduganella lurida TaxID=1036180 RepID=A0A562RET2_9BURK|nr:LacI family DNA-binding transcriptional regulator [Pseudoduganella lurida]TWI67423.1 transcriptional regulator, LacI family [Pseudoduganella lurida]
MSTTGTGTGKSAENKSAGSKGAGSKGAAGSGKPARGTVTGRRGGAAESRRGPSMEDVAHMAGVSPMTVSRVMNGVGKVSAKTQARVKEAAAALNYAPNREARALAGSKPIRIGFLYNLPSVRSGTYLTEILLGLLNQVSVSNVQLFAEKSEAGEGLLEQTRRLIGNALDGIILPPPHCDNPELVNLIAEAGVPLVVIASGNPDPRVSAIGIDDREAAYAMTRNLIELGHRRIGFITGNPAQFVSGSRLAGYRAAIEEFGADAAPDLVTEGLFNYHSGLDAAELLLSLPDRPTAIFASNDDMAAAAVAVAHRMGLDVPGDIAVAGFDDTALATTIWPALTTVRQPTMDMAEAAVRTIVQRVTAERGGSAVPIEHTRLAFELIRRQSDAPPRLRPPARVQLA